MNRNALNCARYWRNAVADAELGRGSFQNKDVAAFLHVESAALRQGRAVPATVEALFSGRYKEAKSRKVLLRPLLYRARVSHGRQRSPLPEVLTPIVSSLVLHRDGRLDVPSNAVVPRDVLEPLGRNAFTIGTIEALDQFLTLHPGPGTGPEEAECARPENWEAYWRYCETLARAVFPDLANDERFAWMDGGLIEARERAGSGRAIRSLYDHVAETQPDAPLFATIASRPLRQAEPCLPVVAGFAERLGHASPLYALARAQRGALIHMLAAQHGEVVAVNGPPGTGKTTLLLSVVASLWAKAALDQGEPPIVLAASTNNQAVTNIIDAFGADFAPGVGQFAGRWLPEVTSFGSYFPAVGRTTDASGRYLTADFFDRIEDADYLDHARAAFLTAAAAAFPDLREVRVETVLAALHHRLQEQARTLASIETAWEALVAARGRRRDVVGDDPEAARAQLCALLEDAEREGWQAQAVRAAWDHHQAAEPLTLVLLGWLPSVAARRLAGARAALRPHWPTALPSWRHVREITAAVERIAEAARAQTADCIARLAETDALLASERACLERWREAVAAVGGDARDAERMTLADCDPLADRHLRFPIFLTTTHYWEARWLLAMTAIEDPAREKRRTGRVSVTSRWRRRMMLTPCAVATFYVLPDLLRIRRQQDGAFVDDYLYDLADLLIVDEAGQVPPEIGGAGFALARRALVIGDTAQIEPIWNIPGRVDLGNLRDTGIITDDDEQADRKAFVGSGRAAASGSIMRIAQNVSRYHQEPELARGLVLTEHRRCFDEIIGYSNDLCYRGKLDPVRGRKADVRPGDFGADGLPALGYLQVDGLCEQLSGGSRRNVAEAETIAAWIADRKAMLEQHYPGYALAEILGIVTPFAAQAMAIRAALNRAGIDMAKGRAVPVGSIHSFQGGQRPVMLFSPTYSKHADGSFIDKSASMLNVAVSRAMNSFLVFGDMDCFSTAPRSSPRGQLGARLFASNDNALDFAQVPRRDLVQRGRVRQLHDAVEHDSFLREALARCRREAQIVTPWLGQRALEDSGVIPALESAVGRGVELTVYTDRRLNNDRARNDSARRDLACARNSLEGLGVKLVDVRDVHSKIVMADDDLFCAGSFNWLSAARQGAYARHETSLVYHGTAVAEEIEAMKASLAKRALR